MQKVSDTSISSSLSLGRYILLKENAGARRAIGLKACNKKLTLTALQENLVLSSQWSLLEGSLAPKLANILTSVTLLTFKVFNNPTKISYLPSPLPFPIQIKVVFPSKWLCLMRSLNPDLRRHPLFDDMTNHTQVSLRQSAQSWGHYTQRTMNWFISWTEDDYCENCSQSSQRAKYRSIPRSHYTHCAKNWFVY